MSEFNEKIECDEHGETYAAFVCQHLTDGTNLGFFCADNEKDPRPDAWCGQCEEVSNEDGGWNEENEKFACITLVCVNCYDEIKDRNLSAD